MRIVKGIGSVVGGQVFVIGGGFGRRDIFVGNEGIIYVYVMGKSIVFEVEGRVWNE